MPLALVTANVHLSNTVLGNSSAENRSGGHVCFGSDSAVILSEGTVAFHREAAINGASPLLRVRRTNGSDWRNIWPTNPERMMWGADDAGGLRIVKRSSSACAILDRGFE